VIEALVEQIEERFAELSAQMVRSRLDRDRRSSALAEVGRAYSQLEPAAKLAASGGARRTTPPAPRSCSPRTARTRSCARC
jgi:hypothetical protein